MRHVRRDAVQIAVVGRVFRQVSFGRRRRRRRSAQETRPARGAVQQGRARVAPGGGRRRVVDDRRLRRRAGRTGRAEGSAGQEDRVRQRGRRPPPGLAHAPAVGGREVGPRRLGRHQHPADEEPQRAARRHDRVRTVRDRRRVLRRGAHVHVPHVHRVRPGVPARLQQGVRHGQPERRARLVGGHAPGAAPDHREQLHVLRRAVLARRLANSHVLERRQDPVVHAGNRPAAVHHKQLSQQRRDGHSHVQGRRPAAERRRRRASARVARQRHDRHADGRPQGPQGPGQLHRRAPLGQRGGLGQRGRHVRRMGRGPVHTAVHHVLDHGVHRRQVPSKRHTTAHVRHQQIHRFLGGAGRLADPRDRRLYGVVAQLAGRYAHRYVRF